MPHLKTEAIPLRVIRYSESSQILTLLSREAGTVSAIAKGAHRKRAGPLDLLQIYRTALITKRSGALATLCEWECLDPLYGIRRQLDRLFAAFFKAEVAGFLAPEGAAAEDVYDTVRDSLRDLARGADPAANTLLFSARMMHLSGYQPSLERCGGCGTDIPLRGTVHFGGGNLLCPSCRGEDARPYAGAAVALVRSLQGRAAAEARGARYPTRIARQAQGFLDDRFREITERDLRTVRYWRQWGSGLDRGGRGRHPLPGGTSGSGVGDG